MAAHPPVTIDYVPDWASRLRSRLYTQFRDSITWNQWIDLVLAPQFQDLENSGQTLLGIYDINNSAGVQLDLIGRIVGQPRDGLSDTIYKTYLFTRILANNATGTAEDIYAVMTTLFGVGAGSFAIGNSVQFGWETTPQLSSKEFVLTIRMGLITLDQAKAATFFLGKTREAGSRAIIVYKTTTPTFKFDGASVDGTGMDVGLFISADQI